MSFISTRARHSGTGIHETGVPQYVNTATLAWGAPHNASGVLVAPRDPSAVPQTFSLFSSVFAGLFGSGNPSNDITRDQQAVSANATKKNQPFYRYHEGDLFTPGTQNFVFEPTTELTPLTTIWGNAFLRTPNTFSVRQPTQVWSDYNKYINGIGGLIAGQYALQPLESVKQTG